MTKVSMVAQMTIMNLVVQMTLKLKAGLKLKRRRERKNISKSSKINKHSDKKEECAKQNTQKLNPKTMVERRHDQTKYQKCWLGSVRGVANEMHHRHSPVIRKVSNVLNWTASCSVATIRLARSRT
ncbi:hypothetical protein ElyMa_001932600 [Elysia marginata]|uniref:Uncharacterized protein n=1 Tax=Elysia marginata TaxID=1093978 RepID=A0AAV4EVS6_9GAST|nr:hypothetical protein ElyMa_001932600 [Elysia marginata]